MKAIFALELQFGIAIIRHFTASRVVVVFYCVQSCVVVFKVSGQVQVVSPISNEPQVFLYKAILLFDRNIQNVAQCQIRLQNILECCNSFLILSYILDISVSFWKLLGYSRLQFNNYIPYQNLWHPLRQVLRLKQKKEGQDDVGHHISNFSRKR